MGLLNRIDNFLGIAPSETKGNLETRVITLQDRPVATVRNEIARDQYGQGDLSAIQIAAIFACARVLAEGLAQIPCLLQRRSPNGGNVTANDHPLYDLLARSPNSFQTSFEFREWIGFQLALNGNAYVYVSRDNKRINELIPLPAGSVQVVHSDGETFYRCTAIDHGDSLLSKANVWHIKGATLNGYSGLNPQQVAARAIGLTNDLENFGSQVFAQGVRPSGILTVKDAMDAEQLGALKQAFEDQYAGVANAQRTLVLSASTEFKATATSADDAQFIESRRYQTEEICRIMRVNPLMIGQATNAQSYGSMEQLFLAHLTHTLKPLFARFEQSAEVCLLSAAEQKAGYRVVLDTRELTLAVANDRANYYGVMRQNGLMTINECREHSGLDRSSDPLADKLQPSANLFGKLEDASTTTSEEPSD